MFTSVVEACTSFAITLLLLSRADAWNLGSDPKLVHVATGTIDIGKPLAPIPIPGGVRLVEPIVGGTLNGSILNATIFGGVAYPAVYNNQTIQVPQITLYGNTSDEIPFLLQEAGIGSPAAQLTRIQLEIGGKYAALSDEFILASVTPNAARTVVTVQAYLVEQS